MAQPLSVDAPLCELRMHAVDRLRRIGFCIFAVILGL